jgi:hypothetical protein
MSHGVELKVKKYINKNKFLLHYHWMSHGVKLKVKKYFTAL